MSDENQTDEVNTDLIRQDLADADKFAQIKEGYTADRDELNQMIGRFQMSQMISKFADVGGLVQLKEIKERKLYQLLKGQKGVDRKGQEIADVGTWEGFCRAIGSSKSTEDERLSNLEVFGENALQLMDENNVGSRQLRQLRKLPEEDRTVLIDEIEVNAGDKDAIADLVTGIIKKGEKEKEALEATVKEQEERIKAKDKVISKKSSENTELLEKNAQLQEMPAPERATLMIDALASAEALSLGEFTGLDGACEKVSESHADDAHVTFKAAQVFQRLYNELDEILKRHPAIEAQMQGVVDDDDLMAGVDDAIEAAGQAEG